MTPPRFSCLIPAYNEAARIGGVLAAAIGHPLLNDVIVIDDGSTDATVEVARKAGATVLALDTNHGKTGALAQGLASVTTSHVVLLDADLEGLTAADITALIAPVHSGKRDATVSLRGNAPRLWHWLGVDYISGERVLPIALLRPHLDSFQTLPRFGFEVFVNGLMEASGTRVEVVQWPGVASPSKWAKRGHVQGVIEDIRMMQDIRQTVPLREVVHQIQYLRGQGKAARPRRQLENSGSPA